MFRKTVRMFRKKNASAFFMHSHTIILSSTLDALFIIAPRRVKQRHPFCYIMRTFWDTKKNKNYPSWESNNFPHNFRVIPIARDFRTQMFCDKHKYDELIAKNDMKSYTHHRIWDTQFVSFSFSKTYFDWVANRMVKVCTLRAQLRNDSAGAANNERWKWAQLSCIYRTPPPIIYRA